jgi:hypothetical protein
VTYKEHVYKGYVKDIEVVYSECQDCGAEFFTEDQNFHLGLVATYAELEIDRWIASNPLEEWLFENE